MGLGIWKHRQKVADERRRQRGEDQQRQEDQSPDDPSSIYRNLLTGRFFRKRRSESKEGSLNDDEIRREVGLSGESDGWKPYWLGLGLFFVLCPFWMLDSLKDPVFADLVEGNLERHQPTAKLFSVVATLLLVCFIEIYSEKSRREKKTGRRGDANEQEKNQDEVKPNLLDLRGHWRRMSMKSSTERHDCDCDDERPQTSEAVSTSMFGKIGISYMLIFLFLMNLLWQYEYYPQGDGKSTIQTGDTSSAFKFSYILAYVIYAAIESYGSLAVATFWSFCNSTLSLHEAERYYGTIVALAQLGAIQGSTLVASNVWPASTLILVACLFMVLQIITMHTYGRRFRSTNISEGREEPIAEVAVPGDESVSEQTIESKLASLSTWSGIHLIVKHNYVLIILGVSCLYEVSLTCLDYQMKLLGYDHFEGDAVAEAVTGYFDGSNSAVPSPKPRSEVSFSQFMGRYGQAVNVTSLLLSSLVFPWLIRTAGLRWTLRLFPTLLLLVTVVAFGALPGNLAVLVTSLSLLKAMTYSIHDPAKELLYLPTSTAIQFRAKFWIDIVGARISKAIGSAINTYAGSADRIVLVGAAPSLLTASALWYACYLAGRQFDSLRESGTIVGANDEGKRTNSSEYEMLPIDLNDAEEASDCSR